MNTPNKPSVHEFPPPSQHHGDSASTTLFPITHYPSRLWWQGRGIHGSKAPARPRCMHLIKYKFLKETHPMSGKCPPHQWLAGSLQKTGMVLPLTVWSISITQAAWKQWGASGPFPDSLGLGLKWYWESAFVTNLPNDADVRPPLDHPWRSRVANFFSKRQIANRYFRLGRPYSPCHNYSTLPL